jgi:membrane-associated phospholipid phosphatase
MKGLFYKFTSHIASSFKGYNLLWHFAAIALTYLIVKTDFDWTYFLLTRNGLLQQFLFPAVILGGLVPILIPLAILAVGKLKKNLKLINTAWALGQAAILGFLISSFYKAFTGRVPPPEIFNHGALVNISHQFQFGFWRGGIFWGWPSSHTTVVFAMAIVIASLYPKNKVLRLVAITYAFYVGLGVSISIHWFSEFVAGAIIGSIIGSVVGKSYRPRLEEKIGI